MILELTLMIALGGKRIDGSIKSYDINPCYCQSSVANCVNSVTGEGIQYLPLRRVVPNVSSVLFAKDPMSSVIAQSTIITTAVTLTTARRYLYA